MMGANNTATPSHSLLDYFSRVGGRQASQNRNNSNRGRVSNNNCGSIGISGNRNSNRSNTSKNSSSSSSSSSSNSFCNGSSNNSSSSGSSIETSTLHSEYQADQHQGIRKRGGNRHIEQNFSFFPNLRLVTANIDGLGTDSERKRKVIKYLEYLMTRYDVACIQEVRAHNLEGLRHVLTGCKMWHSLTDTGKTAEAGVMIIVRQSVLQHYDIDDADCYSSSTVKGRGRIVSIKLKPRTNSTEVHSTCRITNLYLQSGDASPNVMDKIVQLDEVLTQIPKDADFDLIGGDFNIKAGKSSKAATKLEELLADRKMMEVEQDQCTFYRMKGAEITTSCIDRWFSNISLTQELLVEQKTEAVGKAPYTVGSYCHGNLKNLTYIPHRNSNAATHVTDHVPVAFSLHKVRGNGNASKADTIPDWILDHPKFEEHFRGYVKTDWEEITEEGKVELAFDRLTELQNALFATTKYIERNYGRETQRQRSHWELALQTYRALLSPDSDPARVAAAARGDDTILNLVDNHLGSAIANGRRLRNYLDDYIYQQKGESKFSRTPSRIEKLARAFPKHRAKVNYLRNDEGEEITDPDMMANITKKFWGKLFLKRKLKYNNINRAIKRNYGPKSIVVPPTEITKKMVSRTINGMGKTAPGPDNIPFKAYKVVNEEATEVFYYIIQAMMHGKLPPEKFNHSIFHLLPKKGTGYIADTRPLSVSNTYNRIIAAVTKQAIQPALLSYINTNQTGFTPGRSIEENIERFNELFYAALDGNEEYSMLLFDIEKAFDSVSHKTLHALLAHVGLPEHYRNIVKGLFHKVTVVTNFQGANNLDISIERGIKQGCPLSPLLFIVVMDILHHLLQKHADVTVMMFADDTAAGAAKIVDKLKGIKLAFERFEAITGLKLNMTKTLLLTTLAPSKRGHINAKLAEIGWEEVKIAETGIYLGLPIGRSPGTEINQAYIERVKKFRTKIKSYLPHKQRLSLAKRINLINVFLLPLLSYPNRFFVQPSSTSKQIQSDINGFLMQGQLLKTDVYTRPFNQLGARGGSVLVDHQIKNYAELASRIDVGTVQTHNVTGTTRKRFRGKLAVRPVLHTWSLRIKTQRTLAAKHIHRVWGLDYEDFVGKPASVIYKLITSSNHFIEGWKEYTKGKLERYGIVGEGVETIYANHAQLPYWVPDYAIFNQILVWHDALFSSNRLARIHQEARKRGEKRKTTHIQQVQPCYLCGDEEDKTEHIYGSCTITRKALIMLWGTLGFTEAAVLKQNTNFINYSMMNWTTTGTTYNTTATPTTTSTTTTATGSSSSSSSSSSNSSSNRSSSSSSSNDSNSSNNSNSSSRISSSSGSGGDGIRGNSSSSTFYSTTTTTTITVTTTTTTTATSTTTTTITSTYTSTTSISAPNSHAEALRMKIGVQYVFNFLVYQTREDITNGEQQAGAADRIYNSCIDRLGKLAPAMMTNSQLPGNTLPDKAKQDFADRVRSFGSSGKRTKEQAAAAKEAVKSIQQKLPKRAIEVWTDGSKIGRASPGPAGAGVYIKRKGHDPTEITYHLGDSTNQVAEIWAIGGALEHLMEQDEGDEEVHIFSDSKFALDCLEGKIFSKQHFYMIAKVKKLARIRKGAVHYHHVAGHAGITENDCADTLAKAGAEYSKTHPSINMLELEDILDYYSFNYMRIDGIT